MPAKPVASQVCNVAPCNHTCRCDAYNFWRCDVIPQNATSHGQGEVRLILSVNGQETIASVFDFSTPLVFCLDTYVSEDESFRHPCPSGNGWCHYWQGDYLCNTASAVDDTYLQEYCVKRID